jgi:hypothetical protein
MPDTRLPESDPVIPGPIPGLSGMANGDILLPVL